ncbi:MAG: hypothetical protein AB7O59_11290 [Pirellulales bacterium]
MMRFTLRALFQLTAASAVIVWLVLALPRFAAGAAVLAIMALGLALTAMLSLGIVGMAVALCAVIGKAVVALDLLRSRDVPAPPIDPLSQYG